MAHPSLKDELNESLEGRFRRSTDYESIALLIIYWKDCTDKGYKKEALELGQLFRVDFEYSVEYYEIPTIDICELELDTRINRFLVENRKPETLLIIHYGGHGNADDDPGQNRESVWCAEPDEDSPFLKWSNIQPKFAQHTSEVLLLLDCCYGAQAARDSRSRRQSPIPPNVELFAACGMGEKTVRPGPRSFTSLLVAEFRRQLTAYGFAVVATAHKNMASKQSQLGQSAVYFPFEKKNGTTRLEPTRQSALTGAEPSREAASLVLHLSVSDGDREAFREVVEWLKLNPPRTVSRVVVENIITSAAAVYNYASDESRGYRSMENVKTPPDIAKEDVSSKWNTFSSIVGRLAWSVAGVKPSPASPASSTENEMSENIVRELGNGLKPLQSAIERNIMALPELENEEALLKVIDNKMVEDLGFADMLKLRLIAHFGTGDGLGDHLEAQVDNTTFKSDGLFLNLSIEDVPGLGRVLVECRKYSKESAQGERPVLASSKRSMQKLAELLNSSKPSDFHSLTCLRYFHEAERGRYGLIFKVPEGSRPLQISLRDIIGKITGRYKPTLSQRFEIAHKIGTALLKWHLVGWVHQGIASHNIVFFYDEEHGVDYSRPYLCGFEYSRESTAPSHGRFVEDFELNVYRHPDRQGIPTKYHRKEHDLYAYGIFLLEIGLWKLVGKFFDDKEKTTLSPYQMGQKIITASQGLLAHSMDTLYERATLSCLTGDFGVEEDDVVQSRLASAFDAQVLEKIRRGVVIANDY